MQSINKVDLKRIETLFVDRFVNLEITYKPNKKTSERLFNQGLLLDNGNLSATAIQEVLNKTPYRMALLRKRGVIWEKLDKEKDQWIAATKKEVSDFIDLALGKEGKFTQSGEIFIFTYKEKT